MVADGKMIKETKKSRTKKESNKFNPNQFKNQMRKEVNRKKEKEQSNCAKIVKAARTGDMEFIKPGGSHLSEKQRRRMKIDCLDEVGYSPLHHAARKGKIDFLRSLLDMGANVEIQNDSAGWTPLQEASYWGQLEAVKALLNGGANVNHLTKKNQNSLPVPTDSDNEMFR